MEKLYINKASHIVRLGKKEVDLTFTEFGLLLLLARRRGKVVSRNEILNRIWSNRNLDTDRTINVHICRLRKKIESNPDKPRRLISVRRFGYMFK